jgi:uncharacterized repeat protein (TIGR01451 family)
MLLAIALGVLFALVARADNPDLVIQKTVSDTSLDPGQVITFTITIRNNGSISATRALVSDTLPDGLVFAGPVTLQGTNGTVANSADELPFLASNLTITAGSHITLIFPVTVHVPLTAGVKLTNTASVTCAETITPGMGSVEMTVNNVAPVLVDATRSVSESAAHGDNVGTPLTGTDANGDTLTYTISADNSGGMFAIGSGTGQITVTDNTNLDHEATSQYTLTVQASDGALTDTATVTITVSDVNEAPVAADEPLTTTDEDTPLNIHVLANDSDPDAGDVLTVTAVSTPAYGSVVVSGTAHITYTPLNWSSTYTDFFTYVASDGSLTDTARVTVVVTADNDAPTAYDDHIRTGENTVKIIDVLNNDSAPDADDVLSIDALGPPVTGTATISGTGENSLIIYTPTLDFEGDDVFTYTVRDAGGLTDTATVTITVGDFYVYMSIICRNYYDAPDLPDLVIEQITATSESVQIVVKNQGKIPVANTFWVDVYINPHPTPIAVNQTWEDVADYGLAWKVTANAFAELGPGGVITLTKGGDYYRADASRFPRELGIGTPIYAQVDSFNANTTYGAVQETHEAVNMTYNNIAGPIFIPSP